MRRNVFDRLRLSETAEILLRDFGRFTNKKDPGSMTLVSHFA
jgi:hypothetical protein